MKHRKYFFPLMSVILSASLLFGCSGALENEDDPTIESSEHQKQNNQ